MTDKRYGWIDYCHIICCLWIVGFLHMERYLVRPRGFSGELTEYITSGVLATFFFLSGFLTWGGYRTKSVGEKRFVGRFIKKRMIRIYPLFFLAATSLFVASHIFDGFEMTTLQYVSTLLGVSWLFPPMIPTLWFCVVLIFYIFITAIVFVMKDSRKRGVTILCLFVGFAVLRFFYQYDTRLLLYYPFFFIHGVCDLSVINKIDKRKRYYFTAVSIIVTVIMGGGVYRFKEYQSLNFILRILMDSIIVICLVSITMLVDELSRNANTSLSFVNEYVKDISSATFCAYLFHRHFYEACVIAIGRFDRIGAWIVVIVLFALSFMIQYFYDRLVKVITLI